MHTTDLYHFINLLLRLTLFIEVVHFFLERDCTIIRSTIFYRFHLMNFFAMSSLINHYSFAPWKEVNLKSLVVGAVKRFAS
jgi:hypothetical protein